MIETHNSTSKSLGEAVDVETDYEWDSGHPVIYAVKIIKQIAKKGQVFYDAQGKAQFPGARPDGARQLVGQGCRA